MIVFAMQAAFFGFLLVAGHWQIPMQVLVILCGAFSIISAVVISYIVALRYRPYEKAAVMLRKHYEDGDFGNVAKVQPGAPHFMQASVKQLLTDWNIVQKEHKRLTSLLSHDMRTPLNHVISLCMLLDEETDKATRTQYMDYIKSQSKAMLDMLTDTLHLMQAAGIEIKKTDVSVLDLKTVVERVMQLLASQMTAKHISLIKDITPGLEVHAEEKRFMLAVIQLLANAIKLSPANGIISLKAREAGDRVIISISGHDSDDEMLSQVYEAFPAVPDKGSLRFADGNTPSLHLAEQIITKHNGNLIAKSENGPDYFFQVHVPICAN